MFGFYRVAAAVPRCEVANVSANVKEIKTLWQKADQSQVALMVFPELCLSAYTCGDLFNQTQLLTSVLNGLEDLKKFSKSMKTVGVVGAPLIFKSRLYNCAVVLQHGKICGVVPKSHLANRKEYYEKRWFSSGHELTNESINLLGENVGFGVDQIFSFNEFFTFGIEICEDLWHVIPPSLWQALGGATVTLNLSASNELIGKASYRRSLVKNQSAKCFGAYVYTSAGMGESSTDVVFGGHALIAENNSILAESNRFAATSDFIVGEIDCQKLTNLRLSEASFTDKPPTVINFRTIVMEKPQVPHEVLRTFSAMPFVPESTEDRNERCEEITAIQACALAKRLSHTKMSSAVIGVSGGLDSTLTLLVAAAAFDQIGLKRESILGVTLPGPGTSNRTLGNAKRLSQALGIGFEEISIVEASKRHLADIKYKGDQKDVTFENAQARERMQILMSMANQHKALMLGTSDLSEIALGWTTYAGDHMSMYNVNCGVPKTLVQYLVKWHADRSNPKIRETLNDILATPISPELIHAPSGDIEQKTEDIIGPYLLHDFFLYHFVRYGASPDKVEYLASKTFADKYSEKEISKWLKVFLERFFANQFKRSCIPDGPKVGTIALSPRGDWRMPSDASVAEWLKST